MNSQECLRSLQDSIKSAESIYEREEVPLSFAGPEMVKCINIAIRNALPRIRLPRETRVEVLRILFDRLPNRFGSSKDMTTAGSMALRARLYGPDHPKVDSHTPMLEEGKLAIREAYKFITGTEVVETEL